MERTIRALIQQNQILKRRLDLIEDMLLGGGFGPITDSAPEDFGRQPRVPGRFPGGIGTVADPAPEDLLNARVIDLIRKFRGGVTDPAPEDFSNIRIKDLVGLIPGGGVTDPAPEDIARLDKTQLEARLTELELVTKRAERLRGMLRERLEQL